MREVIGATLDGVAELTYLSEVAEVPGWPRGHLEVRREEALASADAVLAWMLGAEVRAGELAHLGSAGLIQLLSAGVDQVPFDQIPDGVPVAKHLKRSRLIELGATELAEQIDWS